MKMPKTPPPLSGISRANLDNQTLDKVFDIAQKAEEKGKYYHWDKLRHLTPPDGLSHEDWWFGIKLRRLSKARKVPLLDKKGWPFSFSVPDLVSEQMHKIDLGSGGQIGMPDPIINPHTRDQYLVRSLIREAITSSQLEGAATTRNVAKEMLRSGRKPKDRSEQMILNNYMTMQKIGQWKDEDLTADLVFRIHRMVTQHALDSPEASGRFRQPDEKIAVQNEFTGEIFHEPPQATELIGRMEKMCSFSNGKTPKLFIHPVIRAIILHFWLAYDHPFADGNGRTARALFYWSMLRQGYWLFEFISISEILLKAPSKYELSFLYTETDENDLTYFIIYQAGVIQRAIRNLHDYIEFKSKELEITESLLKTAPDLNHRQQALISHALRHPGRLYMIEEHKRSHKVAYQTARKDLIVLTKLGLLDCRKSGYAFVFIAPNDIVDRLEKL